uniref:Neuroguidin n=2 Tax=Loa loa TaxID=7209 RepID=A0A1I7VA66_LOALO
MSEEQQRYASIVTDCMKTSTELLNTAKEFCIQLQKEKERDGISFYEVKNRDLLAYTRDLVYLMYQMCIGNSIQGDPAIERLVYLRTVLERMRPIEYRMKSHVEKLILLASDGTSNDVKTLRPHPEQLKVDDESEELESENSSDEDASKETKPKKYVPPKLMAVHYNEDEEEVEERKMERARRRALQSSLIQDLRAQYSEAPEEFQDDSIVRRKKQEDVEKQKYEEDYFIRLQMTKKEKHNKRIQDRQNILDELLHFGSYMAVKNTEKGGDNTAGGSAGGKRRKMGKNRKFSKKPNHAGAKGKKGKSKSRKK